MTGAANRPPPSFRKKLLAGKAPYTKRKLPPICVFCGGSDLSGEHLWSKWTHDLLPESRKSYYEEWAGENIPGEIAPSETHSVRSKPFAIKHMKVPVVCRRCNNEWMSSIEQKARPFLTPLITGQPVTLDQSAQRSVAEWVALKVMVYEQQFTEAAVVPGQDRDLFKALRVIPRSFKIWVAAHDSKTRWRSGALRSSYSLSTEPMKERPPPNVQTTALGVGSFFAYTMVSHGFDLSEIIKVGPLMQRVFPIDAVKIDVPSARPLTQQEVNSHAEALSRFANSPRVIRVG